MEKKLDLNKTVLIGRTYDEYMKMFNMGKKDLENNKILDVASGVSSFGAIARKKGYGVTGSDIIYNLDVDDLEEKCSKDLERVLEKLEPVKDLYKWDLFRGIDELKKNRERAYKRFITDYRKNLKFYYYTVYPESSFSDREFDISLVSHFLFMYDDLFGFNFHKEVIKELIRITKKEIRIFPVLNLSGKRSEYVNMIKGEFKNVDIEVKKVDYEFVDGGNEMMIIRLDNT